MKLLGRIWFLSLFCKLLLAVALPLTTDEAYYWVWSQRLQLSYFDHPPMVSWLFWLGHVFEAWGGAVRWPGVILGHFTLLVWLLIWKILFPEEPKKYSWWLCLTLFSPLLGFGALLVTPDLPVVLFWSLATLFFIRCAKYGSQVDFIGLGLALGLGFLSKYHIVLFVPLTIVFLTVEKKWSAAFLKNLVLTFFVGVLVSSPVLIWNYQNGFESFWYQLNHGLGQSKYEFFWTWSYLAAQIVIIFPSVFYLAMRTKRQSEQTLLLYLGWGPILFFFLSSFRGAVEVNWPIIGYPAIFALAAVSAQKIRSLLLPAVFWSFLFCLLGSHLIFPWIPNVPDKLAEFSQFEPVLKIQQKYSPLYAGSYQMASWVWYTSKKPFFKLNGMSRKDLFDDFPESIPNQFPFYLAMQDHSLLPSWVKEKNLTVTEVETLAKNLILVRIAPK